MNQNHPTFTASKKYGEEGDQHNPTSVHRISLKVHRAEVDIDISGNHQLSCQQKALVCNLSRLNYLKNKDTCQLPIQLMCCKFC